MKTIAACLILLATLARGAFAGGCVPGETIHTPFGDYLCESEADIAKRAELAKQKAAEECRALAAKLGKSDFDCRGTWRDYFRTHQPGEWKVNGAYAWRSYNDLLRQCRRQQTGCLQIAFSRGEFYCSASTCGGAANALSGRRERVAIRCPTTGRAPRPPARPGIGGSRTRRLPRTTPANNLDSPVGRLPRPTERFRPYKLRRFCYTNYHENTSMSCNVTIVFRQVTRL